MPVLGQSLLVERSPLPNRTPKAKRDRFPQVISGNADGDIQQSSSSRTSNASQRQQSVTYDW